MKYTTTTIETTTWEVEAPDEATARKAVERWCGGATGRRLEVTTADPDDDGWLDNFGVRLRQTKYGAQVRPLSAGGELKAYDRSGCDE